jgi:uncharacterized integral membrane protein
MKKEGDLSKRLASINLKLILIGTIIIIIGFVLMSIGGKSSEEVFATDIFSFRRIVVAPMIALFGFLFLVFAIMYKRKNK